MTEEERGIITGYVERVSGAAAQPSAPAGPWGGRSVPSTAPALPPMDPEADRHIAELFERHPEARYRLTQTAFVQEAALVQAQNRIQELEWQIGNAQSQAQAGQGRGGLLGGLFGGAQRPAPTTPRPRPLQPPPGGYDPRMTQPGRGGGFLATAMTTAAGVAGGMLLGNALMGMFSGGAAEAATPAGDFGSEAVDTPAASPWTEPRAEQGWGGDDAAGYDDGGDFDADL